ncbi:MAG TPA: heme ABC transporter ATP-binding protein CcmA [Gammaproteobacteria bacterium]|jgi:heme exporter protein A|nr:heme ABC transporter ATP-binding protein CcmA [Acidiferrobacteraceae bacterium]MDP6398722.1 cytochrome c biogenesis heme-transporting ATPase CcmA [Arenicellales bacterium]HCX87085.1 heme ABC transporter ATP-binding protein CcmA [Gammaproteobacteria bacterium]MDP6551249.1 cytochrome c biogenesis heme-transporting ATPase CcmA [Arenicellales bacterium]MDP6790809.1 cytochrome c biogenesis heme-transporting ATPase CcmA [Arenicellales bacterium]|tara:strand:+ start:1258 stop:1872 length:615 start_codon:yes stop_codon:yes gene_type:complete
MLEARAISCVKGDRLLFEDFNLQLQRGEICQVHGGNGAGKTSLLRILCGLSLPDSGEVFWNGSSIRQDPGHLHCDLAYIGHSCGLKMDLTASENLAFSLTMQSASASASIDKAIARVGLSGSEDLLCRLLSAGQRRRVAIARLYLTRAPLWVLDEPLGAIDADGVQDIETTLDAHLAENGMVILTSHQPIHLEPTAVRAVHLRN